MDTEQYEDAVRDYEKVYQTEKTKEHKQLLKNAQMELKKSKRKDYYKILGVDKNASEDEIKKAYRKRALMHHPDRHSGASAEIQKEEEKKFKEVGEAFTILSDPKKKARYDSGQDLEEDGMNMGVREVDRKTTNAKIEKRSRGFDYTYEKSTLFSANNLKLQVSKGLSKEFHINQPNSRPKKLLIALLVYNVPQLVLSRTNCTQARTRAGLLLIYTH
ncbi:hypothetical protein L345_13988, partial [Ophiophagus hannah]